MTLSVAPERASATGMAIETSGLGKRFGRTWALRDCSIAIPPGRVSALVGANGAGKTTLMRMLAGLATPSSGTATVVGIPPADDEDFLRRIGYLAQEVPLYRRWTAAEHLCLGAHLNASWDDGFARDRLLALGIPLDRRVGALSGGMRAQVALAMALGKRPQILLLDEPLAALDPLARREFLVTLATAVAEGGLTVLLSSHLLPDLERICDHLVVLDEGHPVLCDDIDMVLTTHRVITAEAGAAGAIARRHRVIAENRTPRQVSFTVRLTEAPNDPSWQIDDVTLEDVVLAYLSRNQPPDSRALAPVDGPR
jgi:ABC-2 type transport system ATP-binding protein